MKISLTPSRRQGNGLIIAVILFGIIGISMASYLSLVRTQNLSVTHSLYWNLALPSAESGIEEAMAHLNKNGNTLNNANFNLSQSGWSGSNGMYLLNRTNADSSYFVSITSNSMSPTIVSTGYVRLAGMRFANTWVKRVIQVKTTNSALLVKSLVANLNIDLKGNNVVSDSYDSGNTNYSTNGLYVASRALDHGDLASNSSLTNSISGGNATVYGKVATGPNGSVSIGSSGAVGDRTWVNAGNHGIQGGHRTDDMNVAFPSVDPPFATAAAPPNNVNISGTNYSLVVGSGNSMIASISLSGNQKILVNGANAVLYITGDFSMSGQSTLTITAGASLKVYMGGNASLTGQGIYNLSGSALNCQFYGLPTCTDFKMSGNPDFTGFLYAPNADFTSTGNSIYYGSVVCKSAKFTGNASFHYDEALGRVGPSRGAVPIEWKEL